MKTREALRSRTTTIGTSLLFGIGSVLLAGCESAQEGPGTADSHVVAEQLNLGSSSLNGNEREIVPIADICTVQALGEIAKQYLGSNVKCVSDISGTKNDSPLGYNETAARWSSADPEAPTHLIFEQYLGDNNTQEQMDAFFRVVAKDTYKQLDTGGINTIEALIPVEPGSLGDETMMTLSNVDNGLIMVSTSTRLKLSEDQRSRLAISAVNILTQPE